MFETFIALGLLIAPTPALAEEAKEPPSIEFRIEDYAQAYAVSSELMKRIAKCESGLRQFTESGEVLRGQVNGRDVGLFQINETYHLAQSRKLGFDIYTLQGNLEYAAWLLSKEGTKPWKASESCWKNGLK